MHRASSKLGGPVRVAAAPVQQNLKRRGGAGHPHHGCDLNVWAGLLCMGRGLLRGFGRVCGWDLAMGAGPGLRGGAQLIKAWRGVVYRRGRARAECSENVEVRGCSRPRLPVLWRGRGSGGSLSLEGGKFWNGAGVAAGSVEKLCLYPRHCISKVSGHQLGASGIHCGVLFSSKLSLSWEWT